MPLSYRNQSTDLQSKSMDWFLYDRDLCHKRVEEQGTNLRSYNDDIRTSFHIVNVLEECAFWELLLCLLLSKVLWSISFVGSYFSSSGGRGSSSSS